MPEFKNMQFKSGCAFVMLVVSQLPFLAETTSPESNTFRQNPESSQSA